MKIAQLVSNFHRVSPLSNHAIYSHVGTLTDSLANLGHDVSLFASGDSQTKATLISSASVALSQTLLEGPTATHYTHRLIAKCYEQAEQFDIIHSHFSLLSSFYARLTKTPTIQSIHSPVSTVIRPLLVEYKDNYYIAFSQAQKRAFPELNWVGTIYHGVDMNTFTYNANPEEYFLYLGRITEEKGVHLAIEAAKAARVPLYIAGRSYQSEGYWHNHIEPHIDGVMVRYIGEAGLDKKIQLLRNAKGLLFPTQYDEVFGYVMIEAMACGTPVIGWNKGSVPEVVKDGVSGFVVNSVREMTRAIKSIDSISRKSTRERAQRLFSVEKMVTGYEKVYQRVIDMVKKKKKIILKKR